MTDTGLLTRGKTKGIFECSDDRTLVRVQNFDDLTAGDGAKHDQFEHKAVYATETTCNVFELLNNLGIPTAFVSRIPDSNTEFMAKRCTMLPYEVVNRRIAMGSYLKRNTSIKYGMRFDPPEGEFYLKTSGKNFKGIALEKDDPLICTIGYDSITVVPADRPPSESPGVIISGELLDWAQTGDSSTLFYRMRLLSYWVFVTLEHAWKKEGFTLADMKIEFGITTEGELVVADVIDNDSWRVISATGEHLDKQLYRDGADLETVAKKYQMVAQLTKSFIM